MEGKGFTLVRPSNVFWVFLGFILFAGLRGVFTVGVLEAFGGLLEFFGFFLHLGQGPNDLQVA